MAHCDCDLSPTRILMHTHWAVSNTLSAANRFANKGVVAHLTPSRGHCSAFNPTIPPLQVALSFACSVASLSQSPSFQLPGSHSLHYGLLADYLLGWGRASTCTAGHVQAPMHFHTQSPMRVTGVTSQHPCKNCFAGQCLVVHWAAQSCLPAPLKMVVWV